MTIGRGVRKEIAHSAFQGGDEAVDAGVAVADAVRPASRMK
jgi:hypothetical protein